jgi:hypothetical protein
MPADDDHLAEAKRYVEEAQRIVWEQKGRIIRLRAAGLDTLDAERRGGPGCLNRFSASISGVSAEVRLPSGMAVG